MHELSLAEHILDIVRTAVPDGRASDIDLITVRVGDLAGVVIESLEFCFDAITRDTELDQARLVVERVPFAVECGSCREVLAVDFGTAECPACRSTDIRMVSGRELQVAHIALRDPVPQIRLEMLA